MADYLNSLIAVAAVASLAGLLSYGGSFEKWQKFAVSVILIYVTAIPVFSLISSSDGFDFDNISGSLPDYSDESFYDTAEDAFKLGIQKLITEKFGIPKEEIFVAVKGFELEKMRAEKIEISLFGSAAAVDYRLIENYIENSSLGDCEVEYAFA